jgi:hypothetical protein
MTQELTDPFADRFAMPVPPDLRGVLSLTEQIWNENADYRQQLIETQREAARQQIAAMVAGGEIQPAVAGLAFARRDGMSSSGIVRAMVDYASLGVRDVTRIRGIVADSIIFDDVMPMDEVAIEAVRQWYHPPVSANASLEARHDLLFMQWAFANHRLVSKHVIRFSNGSTILAWANLPSGEQLRQIICSNPISGVGPDD